MKLPKLTVTDGSSGLSIRAVPEQPHDCAEFTLRADVPIDVLISPWMQFEPPLLADWRSRIANEIVRRAMAHDSMLTELETLHRQVTMWRQALDGAQDKNMEIAGMLRELVEERDGKCYIKLDKGTDVTKLLTYKKSYG